MPGGWVGGMFIPSYIDVVEIIQIKFRLRLI